MARDLNRISDEGGDHDQGQEDERQRTDGGGSQTVSRKSQGGAAPVGTGSGNKSGGDGKKAVEHHRKDNSGE